MATSTGINEQLVHLFAGGLGGTAGAVATCPLEVLKTRMQSSSFSAMFQQVVEHQAGPSSSSGTCGTFQFSGHHNGVNNDHRRLRTLRLVQLLRQIHQAEGLTGFFKGLGPNLVGVAPSRAIYFCTYSWCKGFWNQWLPADSAYVHIGSAIGAGLSAATATNPVWLVKTRLQLDRGAGNKRMTYSFCIRNVYRESGVRGFYKGVQASYLGIIETVIHFVIYEQLKLRFVGDNDQRRGSDFLRFMMCGATSRLVAALSAYPHEVLRTRLREEGSKYKSLLQTIRLIWREETVWAFYRGLGVHLIRTIPNTAIMMSTYELVVYLCLR